jgi:hypothetical protein
MRQVSIVVAVVVSLAGVGQVHAQSLPTSQPNFLQITIEEVKIGHDDEHSKLEAGWPAAFEKAKSPYYEIGMVALTGAPQAWFLTPFENHQAMGDNLKRNADDPILAAELSRLSRADAAHITNLRQVLLAARKDLSRGAFPDAGRQRFYEVTIFRVRPGHEDQFAAAAKAYGAAAGRTAPNTAYRVYEAIAGMTAPAYMVISSVVAFNEFDKSFSNGQATMKGLTKEEETTLQKFATEALVNSETQRFRLDPNMCYVPKEVKAQDSAFWNPKKPAVKTPTAPPIQ